MFTPILTLTAIFIILAFILCLWHAISNSPTKPALWGSVLCLCLAELLHVLPVGR